MDYIAGFLNGVILMSVIMLIVYRFIYRPIGRRRKDG